MIFTKSYVATLATVVTADLLGWWPIDLSGWMPF